jgi:hypothetical protein
MNCPDCPCPDICKRLEAYCAWAAKDPPDPVEIRHICDASARSTDAPHAYPPAATMAGNLALSLWDWACCGFRITPEPEQARRLAICRACEWFDLEPQRCRHHGCGCFVEMKIKLRSAHCPLPQPKW